MNNCYEDGGTGAQPADFDGLSPRARRIRRAIEIARIVEAVLGGTLPGDVGEDGDGPAEDGCEANAPDGYECGECAWEDTDGLSDEEDAENNGFHITDACGRAICDAQEDTAPLMPAVTESIRYNLVDIAVGLAREKLARCEERMRQLEEENLRLRAQLKKGE
ncbi:MAG: hypothetical protein VB092_07835 [Oscillospiraceae bacterium]|nr:hypothetical protein [Oscillospiraceae bacterium]